MNAIELLNQHFGRYLVPQTSDAVADAQAALSGGVAGGVVAHLDGVDYWRRNLTPVGV